MRALVFLLVLANLLFFAFAQGYLGGQESPDASRLQQQLNADKLRIAGREEAPQAARPAEPVPVPPTAVPVEPSPATVPAPAPAPQEPSKPEAAAPVPAPATEPPAKAAVAVAGSPSGQVCLQLAGLSLENADQLAAQARQAKLEVSRRSEGSWWVFLPPQADKKGADKKAGELQRLGVTEYFILTDGPQKFAISLGVFSREEAAQKRLEQVRLQGVRSARMGPRNTESSKQLLVLKGDEGSLAAFRQHLPDGVSGKECP